MTDPKCKDIVDEKLKGRIEDLQLVWKGYRAGYEGEDYGKEYVSDMHDDKDYDNCPICEKEILEYDSTTTICKACFDQLDALGPFNEFGLCFDYVAPDTFDDQKEGMFRYQLSYGGPSDEFRFFINPDFTVHRIEYWYLDWFDGAPVTLSGDDLDLLTEIYNFFDECETTKHEFKKATEGM